MDGSCFDSLIDISSYKYGSIPGRRRLHLDELYIFEIDLDISDLIPNNGQ